MCDCGQRIIGSVPAPDYCLAGLWLSIGLVGVRLKGDGHFDLILSCLHVTVALYEFLPDLSLSGDNVLCLLQSMAAEISNLSTQVAPSTGERRGQVANGTVDCPN